MMRLSDLRVRDVVNIADGKRLGALCDVEVDLENGRITALVVPGSTRMMGLFGHDPDVVIPWSDIVKIGHDVILVHLSAGEGAAADTVRPAGAPPPRGEGSSDLPIRRPGRRAGTLEGGDD